jgi:hypothetical protein
MPLHRIADHKEREHETLTALSASRCRVRTYQGPVLVYDNNDFLGLDVLDPRTIRIER